MSIKLNLGSGQHPLEGFMNLDAELGWCFEDGLHQYQNEEVDAITVSHSLMYVREEDMLNVMQEFWRVLKPGGVVRITEDNTHHWKWHGRNVDTTPELMFKYMTLAGFRVADMEVNTTMYTDNSLIQEWHPKAVSFYIEGKKI